MLKLKRILKKLKFHTPYIFLAVSLRTVFWMTKILITHFIPLFFRKLNALRHRTVFRVKNHLRQWRQKILKLRDRLIERGIFLQTFHKVLSILKSGDPEKTISFLKKYRFLIYPSVRFLKNLYQYAHLVENKNLKLWAPEKTGEKVILHFCCWSASYANKVKNYLLPSLLSENNLPSISKKYNVVLLIHCDRITKNMIIQSGIYDQLIKYTAIEFCVFPFILMRRYRSCIKRKTNGVIFPTVRYLLLGVCQTHAFKVALANHAYISFLMPDLVLSESFMSFAFEKIADKKVILTTTYRTNHDGVSADLKQYHADDGGGQRLTISANKLVELQIKHIHPDEQKRIVSTVTQNFTPMARLLFRNKRGFIFRCFHYHPVIINCKDISRPIKLDYLPIDNTALNCILDGDVPYHDQTWVCDDACQMSIMELSDESPEAAIIINTKTLSYQELVSQVRDLIVREPKLYDSPFNQFLISHRHRFIIDSPEIKENVGDVIDDAVFFSEIYNSLDPLRSS